MELKFPTLLHDVDCAPVDYPGMVVHLRLNIGYDERDAPWQDIEDDAEAQKVYAKVIKSEPWRADMYYTWGRVIHSITFPPEMTGEDKPTTVELGDAKAVYDLVTTPGFDQGVLTWAVDGWAQLASDRWKAEAKN